MLPDFAALPVGYSKGLSWGNFLCGSCEQGWKVRMSDVVLHEAEANPLDVIYL